jgi:hypothetical protein
MWRCVMDAPAIYRRHRDAGQQHTLKVCPANHSTEPISQGTLMSSAACIIQYARCTAYVRKQGCTWRQDGTWLNRNSHVAGLAADAG